MPAVLLLLLAAVSLPPKPDHYVTDRAGVLRNANALNEKLANFERQTSDQILVYVDQHLPPNTTIEEMEARPCANGALVGRGKTTAQSSSSSSPIAKCESRSATDLKAR